MFNIGPQELLLILLVALVVVGPKRLPELSRTIGRGLREFRKAQDEVKKTITLGLDEPLAKPTPRTSVSSASTAPETDAAGSKATDTAAAAAPAAPQPDEAADVARALGRGLAEIRRAREEIQRTFRVDLGDRPSPRRRGASTTDTTSVSPPIEAPVSPKPSEAIPEASTPDAAASAPSATDATPSEPPSTDATPPEPPASASE